MNMGRLVAKCACGKNQSPAFAEFSIEVVCDMGGEFFAEEVMRGY